MRDGAEGPLAVPTLQVLLDLEDATDGPGQDLPEGWREGADSSRQEIRGKGSACSLRRP